MIKIYKYPLDFDQAGIAEFLAPPGNVLKVAFQNVEIGGATGQTVRPPHRKAYAWIMHQIGPDIPMFKYKFAMVMTGEELGENFTLDWEHVGTDFNDWLVVHFFRSLPH